MKKLNTYPKKPQLKHHPPHPSGESAKVEGKISLQFTWTQQTHHDKCPLTFTPTHLISTAFGVCGGPVSRLANTTPFTLGFHASCNGICAGLGRIGDQLALDAVGSFDDLVAPYHSESLSWRFQFSDYRTVYI
uniref:Uncharacterized protein n=1 Tax=mine drainage metagenome TaxID=410659 RepID=E6QR35_9ZZZZ